MCNHERAMVETERSYRLINARPAVMGRFVRSISLNQSRKFHLKRQD